MYRKKSNPTISMWTLLVNINRSIWAVKADELTKKKKKKEVESNIDLKATNNGLEFKRTQERKTLLPDMISAGLAYIE